jgi:hypothetical protein
MRAIHGRNADRHDVCAGAARSRHRRSCARVNGVAARRSAGSPAWRSTRRTTGPAIGGLIGYEVSPPSDDRGGRILDRVRRRGRRLRGRDQGSGPPVGSADRGSLRDLAASASTAPRSIGRPGHPGLLPAAADPASRRAGEISFTDPALVAGAGVNIFATRHFAVRPDVESLVRVPRTRAAMSVTSLSLHAVFHIESHPVTPRVR